MLAMLSLRANFTKCLIRYRYGRASHKCLICCHCEQILQKFAWQSTNLNANLPLDCHEFARFRFANSRNDKTACHTDKFVILTCLVILSVSEVSKNLQCEFALLRRLKFFGFFANAQNDNGDFRLLVKGSK